MLDVTAVFLWIGALMLVAVSFSLKWVRYTAADVSGREEAQVRLKRVIAADGFKFVANVALTADGAIEGLIFEKAGCDAPLYVSLLGASGGTEHILSQFLDGAPVAFALRPVSHWGDNDAGHRVG